ncbi:MAG: inositol monophosphatase [Cyclobacteriaceae bacterium]|nr:inositol monophosphatase [Cyclobacteriaceae bacterium]MCB9238186.1 inositol monophosphatase [Flammeovirgaceae bacterium]MCB0500724.1 inositol monophosphatase [Cyclobacteriaceae bacterium]MCO5272111.1 inositol monophosphatase [Cyclobacteriaceae bacterium]MCW5902774.1 inositol monophosphatase [Cyclobacteriaceae bacterium]
MIDLRKLEKDVIELSGEVANFIGNEVKGFDKNKIEHKDTSNNLVSYVDKEAEKKLVKALKGILPGAGFLAEEGTTLEGDTEYKWIVDPLDGTTNFTHGLPPFAVSIGLARKDKVILGVVHEVSKMECFSATEEGPATCNGKAIKISGTQSLNDSLLATGFPYYHFDKREEYLSIIKTFLEVTHGVRRMGSAATDLAYVACGRMDGFFEYNLNPWDVAAGSLLVERAGGRVTDFMGGNDFLYGGQICAGGYIQPAMVEVIKEHWGA